MPHDITVKDWSGLMHHLYNIPKGRHNRYRSDFVYRGLASKDWSLETSLRRLSPAAGDVEVPLLRNFAKYAKPGEIPSSHLLFKLAVAQHHGLPTRLMDWTVSPKVAAHFATFEEEHYDKDGVIWCADVVKCQSFLPPKLKKKLKEERAFLFSIEMLDSITTLAEFDKLGAKKTFALFFEPPSLDDRIINQGAIMSVMPGVGSDISDFLQRNNLSYRIIIPKKLKWELRDKLDQDNVTERMLFPGLDGLSRWLKRYYGPGSSVPPPAKKKLPASRTP